MTDLSTFNPLVTFWMAVLGALLGSGLDCAAMRYAQGKSWVSGGRSECDSCGHPLNALDLIPIVSYLIRRGRCAHCGARIPLQCLGAEVAGALGFALIGWHFGLSLQLGMWAIFAILLLALSLVDLQIRIIPNGLLVAAVINRVVWFIFMQEPITETLYSIGLSALVPAVLLVLVLIYEKVRNQEAFGGGDIKLLLVMALYLAWPQLVLAMLVACVLGIVAAKGQMSSTIPFGPALAAGCVLAATVLAPVAQWYVSLF